MGSHVVVRPIIPGWDDDDLDEFLSNEAVELNRDWTSAMQLGDELRGSTALTLVALDFDKADGSQIVGFVALTRGHRTSNAHVGHLRIHVDAEYRSNGLGAKLLRRALFWSDRKGIERIVATPYVACWKSMSRYTPGKLAFFFRHGFEAEGYAERFARLLDGTYTGAALLARFHS